MRRKRIAIPVLSLLVVFLALAAGAAFTGCGSGEGAGNGDENEEAPRADTAAEVQPEAPAAGEAAAEAALEEPAVSTAPPTLPSTISPPTNTAIEPAMVVIPSLIGLPGAEAAATLNSLGFQVSTAQDHSEHYAAGLVCDQEPSAGGSAAIGSTVTLVVSLGQVLKTCTECGGDGIVTSIITCPECGGTGYCYT